MSPHFFTMHRYIDLIFGMWVYNDKLQIKCTLSFGSIIFDRIMALGPWNLAKYLVVPTFFSLWLGKLTWFVAWEWIVISYRSTLKFVPVEWFVANLQSLGFEIWTNIQLSPLPFTMLWDIDLIFDIWNYNDELQIKFSFCFTE